MGKVQTVQKKTTVRERPATIARMINEARKEATSNGYDVFGGAKSLRVKRCPVCKKVSLVGCISSDKEFIIAFCFNRYNNDENSRCVYSKKWPNPKVEEDKSTVPEATPNSV